MNLHDPAGRTCSLVNLNRPSMRYSVGRRVIPAKEVCRRRLITQRHMRRAKMRLEYASSRPTPPTRLPSPPMRAMLTAFATYKQSKVAPTALLPKQRAKDSLHGLACFLKKLRSLPPPQHSTHISCVFAQPLPAQYL